jgi:hypothetical protein
MVTQFPFFHVHSCFIRPHLGLSVSSAPRNANGANANEFMLHVLAYHAPLDGGMGLGADLLNGGGTGGGRSENSFSALLAHWANDTDLHATLTTPIRVDGPYGALAMRDWRDNYSHLLFCGGGSGVAPLMAMVSELLRLHAERRLPHVQSVHLIWVRTKIACELVEHIQMGIIASFDEK